MESASESPSRTRGRYRGKACGNCRRRKIKCDGVRPACSQCVRSARPTEECEYPDGTRSETQELEENIRRLEARIRELQVPQDESSVRLHDPYTSGSSSASSLQVSQTPSTSTHTSHSGQVASSSVRVPGHGARSSSHSRGLSGGYSLMEEPPRAIIEQLLDSFLPHAPDFGFFLNVDRFRASALTPLPLGHFSRPCAGLVSTVYLLGLHLSRPETELGDENAFLSRALVQVSNILPSGHPRRIVHCIQAEILLSTFFFRTGRILEGKYHLGAAVSITLAARLHKIRSANDALLPPTHQLTIVEPMMPAPVDQTEEGERINAFWMAFTISNCWGVAESIPHNVVDTPWPLDIIDYEQNSLPQDLRGDMTVEKFITGVPSVNLNEFSTMAMYAKSSTLLARATTVTASYSPSMSTERLNRFVASVNSLDTIIEAFRSSLLPVDQTHPTSTAFGTVFASHTIAYVATIQLHSVLSSTFTQSGQKILSAAEGCVELIRQIDMNAVPQVNPLFGVLWTSVCQVFVREIARLRALRSGWGSSVDASASVEKEAELIEMLEETFEAMGTYAVHSPLMAHQLAKVIEAYRAS